MFNLNKNTSSRAGLASIAIVIIVVAIAAVGMGTYVVVSRESDNVTDEQDRQITADEESTDQDTKEGATTTTPDISPPPAPKNIENTTPALATGKVSARVVASHEFATNPGFEPGKVNITCNVPTDMEVFDIFIYSGVAGQGPIGGAGTPPNSLPRASHTGAFKSVSYTYKQPGNYTITCVPLYPGDQNISLLDSPFVGTKTVTVGDTTDKENDFTFAVSPTQGKGTIDIDASCRANNDVSGSVTGLTLMLDYPTIEAFLSSQGLTEADLQNMSEDEQFALLDEFLPNTISATADSQGGVTETFWRETVDISDEPIVEGNHTIYCVASFLDNTQKIVGNVNVFYEK